MIELEILNKNTLYVDDGLNFYRTYTFYPDKKEFKEDANSNNDFFNIIERSRYKISVDPLRVFVKTIERSSNPPKEYQIRDGVVLESEILKNANSAGSLDLTSYREAVEYQEIHLKSISTSLYFFILSLHPDIISNEEYRKLLRKNYERFSNALLKIQSFLDEKCKTGLKIFDGEHSRYIWYQENKHLGEEQKEAIKYVENKIQRPIFDQKSDDFCGISKDEFSESQAIMKSLQFFLGDDKHPSSNKDLASNDIPTGWKWILVIILSIIALKFGIWTAIGVFVLGSIIINTMSK